MNVCASKFKVQMPERALIELDLHGGSDVWPSWLPEDAHVLTGD